MTTNDKTTPTGAHLVGSVPLADSGAVFQACCEHLGGHLRRLPDGETGERSNWIAWQREVFATTPQLQSVADDAGGGFQLRPGVTADEVVFPELGYATAALASYTSFSELQAQGVIPAHLRFQVSLPTPLAPVQFYIAAEDRADVEPVYEAALLRELDRILAVVPADKLAIQWDTAVEFGVLEGVFPAFFADPEEAICERLVRLGEAIPDEVELGFHLCYGDSGHKHFVEPADTGWLTRVANLIVGKVNRAVQWIHLPVPRDRRDPGYFAPLAGLELLPETQLYLGLLHTSDGAAGAAERVAAAQEYVGEFGVATECGFGRRAADSIPGLLSLHAEMAAPLPVIE